MSKTIAVNIDITRSREKTTTSSIRGRFLPTIVAMPGGEKRQSEVIESVGNMEQYHLADHGESGLRNVRQKGELVSYILETKPEVVKDRLSPQSDANHVTLYRPRSCPIVETSSTRTKGNTSFSTINSDTTITTTTPSTTATSISEVSTAVSPVVTHHSPLLAVPVDLPAGIPVRKFPNLDGLPNPATVATIQVNELPSGKFHVSDKPTTAASSLVDAGAPNKNSNNHTCHQDIDRNDAAPAPAHHPVQQLLLSQQQSPLISTSTTINTKGTDKGELNADSKGKKNKRVIPTSFILPPPPPPPANFWICNMETASPLPTILRYECAKKRAAFIFTLDDDPEPSPIDYFSTKSTSPSPHTTTTEMRPSSPMSDCSTYSSSHSTSAISCPETTITTPPSSPNSTEHDHHHHHHIKYTTFDKTSHNVNVSDVVDDDDAMILCTEPEPVNLCPTSRALVSTEFVQMVYTYLAFTQEPIARMYDDEMASEVGWGKERVEADRFEALREYIGNFVEARPKIAGGEGCWRSHTTW